MPLDSSDSDNEISFNTPSTRNDYSSSPTDGSKLRQRRRCFDGGDNIRDRSTHDRENENKSETNKSNRVDDKREKASRYDHSIIGATLNQHSIDSPIPETPSPSCSFLKSMEKSNSRSESLIEPSKNDDPKKCDKKREDSDDEDGTFHNTARKFEMFKQICNFVRFSDEEVLYDSEYESCSDDDESNESATGQLQKKSAAGM